MIYCHGNGGPCGQFVKHYKNVGKALSAAQQAYGDGEKKLKDRKPEHRIIGQQTHRVRGQEREERGAGDRCKQLKI